MLPVRLGVNIDHIATLRNARNSISYPDLLRATTIIAEAGGDSITVHLREDRRHIRDQDVIDLIQANILPINLEMAATDEMVKFALQHKPKAVCLVPEKRQELTTEGGLDAYQQQENLRPTVAALRDAGIQVALFLDTEPRQLETAAMLGVYAVELHTGAYADAIDPFQQQQFLALLQQGAQSLDQLGIHCHVGHGLTYNNVNVVAAIPQVEELNIGHFIVCEAVYSGLFQAVQTMKQQILHVRASL